MNKPKTIEGRWWIHGDDKPAHFGILSFDPEGGLELTVKIPQDRTVEGTFISSLRGHPALPGVIHGADVNNNPVTLFGCALGQNSLAAGLDAYRVSSIAGILNYRGQSWKEARFRTVEVRYSLLHRWMDRSVVKTHKRPDTECAFTPILEPAVLTELMPGIRLRIQGIFEPDRSIDSLHYEFDHRVYFHFSEPRTVGEIHDEFVGVLLRLLCFLTGERVFVDRMQLLETDPFEPNPELPLQVAEFLQDCSGISKANRDKHGRHMITTFPQIATAFPQIVRRWFECHAQLQPVVDLYLVVRSGQGLTPQNAFLFLAQALEVYHARSSLFSSGDIPTAEHKARVQSILRGAPVKHKTWLKEKLAFANLKTLAQRLEDILKLHPEESGCITAKMPDFASKIRHTRNYYTHYNEEPRRKGKVAEDEGLITLTYALKALLEISLLKELGITGMPIERILRRSLGLSFYSVDGP